jgi:hypothetical protein
LGALGGSEEGWRRSEVEEERPAFSLSGDDEDGRGSVLCWRDRRNDGGGW